MNTSRVVVQTGREMRTRRVLVQTGSDEDN